MKKSTLMKLLALTLAVLMMFSAAACGGNNSGDKGGETSDENVNLDDMDDIQFDNPTEGEGIGDASGDFSAPEISTSERKDVFNNIPTKLKGTTVKFAHWGDEGGDEYVKVAKAFTKKTGINVKWELYSEQTYAADLATKIASGAGPDIVILNDTIPQMFEVTQTLPKIFDINDDFWDPRVTKLTSLGGKGYFVNSYYSTFVPTTPIVVYNKKIFNDNGITSPVDYIKQGDWSWENFKKCMEDATKAGYYGGILDARLMAWTMGKTFLTYDAAAGKMISNSVNTGAIADALKFYAQCREENLCGNYVIAQYPAGNIAMLTTDCYAIKRNGYLKEMSVSSFGAVRMPDTFEGKACDYGGTGIRAYGIANGAKNVEGAYYFLRWYLDIDIVNETTNIFGNKEMQKFYTEEILGTYRTRNLKMDAIKGPLYLVNKDWTHSVVFQEARKNPPSQILTAMASVQNIFDSAAEESNKILEKVKKAQ